MRRSPRHVVKRLLVAAATFGLALMFLAGGAPGGVGVSPAAADDGDGGGGGGGGGGSAGDGGDSWNPWASQRRWSRRGKRRSARNRETSAVRVRGEIVALGLTPQDVDRLAARGFRLIGDEPNSLLGTRLSRLSGPRRQSSRRVLRLARRELPDRRFAENNLYSASPRIGYRSAGEPCRTDCRAQKVTAWSAEIAKCSMGLTLGLVDTGIDTSHPALTDARIEVLDARREDMPGSDKSHGTAVASLLVGRGDGDVPGLLPSARLVAVDAFHTSGNSDQADTFDLIVALRMLAQRNVTLVNMSLTGPDNDFLADAVVAAQRGGMTIVAAAGIPSRRAGYPAKYRDVVAVAAVDVRLRATRLSARGDHISFSAPGSGLVVAAPGQKLRLVDGTSFATPFVAAAYAVGLGGARQRGDLTSALSAAALDLGRPGRDQIYGWGLLQYSPLRGC